MQDDIVRMYVSDGLGLREIGEKIGVSRQTICNVLQDAGVRAAQKGRKPAPRKGIEHDKEILRLYVDEDKPIVTIAKVLKLSAKTVTESLRVQGVAIKRGGMRMIVFPELRRLKTGESLELPRVNPTSKQAYVRYYEMAKFAGIKVSVRVIDEERVRVTRKA